MVGCKRPEIALIAAAAPRGTKTTRIPKHLTTDTTTDQKLSTGYCALFRETSHCYGYFDLNVVPMDGHASDCMA